MAAQLNKQELDAYSGLMQVVFAAPRVVTADLVAACGLGSAIFWCSTPSRSEDARGTVAVLTEAGQSRLEHVYQRYLSTVRRHVLDHHRPTP